MVGRVLDIEMLGVEPFFTLVRARRPFDHTTEFIAVYCYTYNPPHYWFILTYRDNRDGHVDTMTFNVHENTLRGMKIQYADGYKPKAETNFRWQR